MQFIDTHCHMQSAGSSDEDDHTAQLWAKAPELTPASMIAAAAAAGVSKQLCVGCNLPDSRQAVSFVQDKASCFATIGIHPHEATEALAHGRTIPEFAALIHQPKVVAVGECGLDYHYNYAGHEDQLTVLEFQIALAIDAGLPMIFHVREAFDDFWPLFDRYEGKINGVLHSFTDNQRNLDKALERNLRIGVNGIATFTKEPKQLAVYTAIPLANLILETDAPYLTPSPFRGKINESKQVRVVAEFLADLRGESLAMLAEKTTTNAEELFDI